MCVSLYSIVGHCTAVRDGKSRFTRFRCRFTTDLLIIITKLSLQVIAVIRNDVAAVGHIPLVVSPSLPHPPSPDGNVRSHSVHLQNEQARLLTCMNGLPLGPCRFVSHPADQVMRAHPYLAIILL